MRKVLLCALLLFTVWCAIPTRNLVYQCIDGFVPVGFSAEELVAVQHGFDRFNDFVGTPGLARLSSVGECSIRHDFYSVVYDGYWIENIKTITIHHGLSTDDQDDRLERVVMHEVGHTIGFQHTPDGSVGIMNRETNGLDWSESDLAECQRINVCK